MTFRFKLKSKKFNRSGFALVLFLILGLNTLFYNNCTNQNLQNNSLIPASSSSASLGSGGSGGAGHSPPLPPPPPRVGDPAWLNGKPLNAWFPIPNTQGAGGAAVNAWGGFALREDTSEVFIAASGGHSDSSDNRVVSIDLMQDAPQWVIRSTPTPSAQVINLAAYYGDNKPGSRHNYHHNMWIPQVHRIMMFGQRGRYVDGSDNFSVDGFNPDNNTWDPPQTWASLQQGWGFGSVKNGVTGEVWTGGLMKWSPTTNAWSRAISNGAAFRWPAAFDSTRNTIFALQYGDGQGYDLQNGIVASRINISNNTQSVITFNSSPALTQFQTDQPTYSGMDYDPVNDQFLFYCAMQITNFSNYTNVPNRIYVVRPNTGTVWDMELLSLHPNNITPEAPPSSGSGINSRFKYVPALRGFVMLPNNASNVYFLRTSN